MNAPATFPVTARPYTGGETLLAHFPAGQTIAQALGPDIAYSARVILGGVEVPRALWDKIRPRPGIPLEVTVIPQGGNGGKALRLVAFAVLVYFTAGAGATWAGSLGLTGTAASAAYAGAFLLGSMAINALIPPPMPHLGAGNGDPFQQLQSITGTSNQAAPYQAIPCVVGTMRFMPLPVLQKGESITLPSGVRMWRPVDVPGVVPRDRCIHEAGHAITAWWTGKGIAAVVVSEVGLNLTQAEKCLIEGDDESSVRAFCTRQTRTKLNDLVLRELVEIMGGPMAEGRLKGYGLSHRPLILDPGYRQWQKGDPPSDLHAWIAMSLLPRPKDRARVANRSVKVCAAVLAFYWPQVELLADLLGERRMMSGPEILDALHLEPRAPNCRLELGGAGG